MFQSLDQGISQDKYFEIQQQMGQPIEEDKVPRRIEDFPDLVILAINIFNRLGDRVYPEIGYVGKDYTNLNLYMNTQGIEKRQEDFFLEILEWLDARAIKKSSEQLKREYDKMKRKSSGRK